MAFLHRKVFLIFLLSPSPHFFRSIIEFIILKKQKPSMYSKHLTVITLFWHSNCPKFGLWEFFKLARVLNWSHEYFVFSGTICSRIILYFLTPDLGPTKREHLNGVTPICYPSFSTPVAVEGCGVWGEGLPGWCADEWKTRSPLFEALHSDSGVTGDT